MSTMACSCGAIMRNTVYPCPTEGWLLREGDQERLQYAISRDIAAYLAAIQEGRRDVWIREFYSPHAPSTDSDQNVIIDIIMLHERDLTMSVVECEQCGRLWVQRSPGEISYRSFAPDEEGYTRVLRSMVKKSAEPDGELSSV